MSSSKRPDTRIVHTGSNPKAQKGVVNPPVYRASTVIFPTVQAMKDAEKNKFDSAVAEAVEKRVTEMKEVKASSDEPSESEASKKENLEEVLEATEQVTPEISNTNEASSGETETLRTKFQSAFSKENIKVTY